MDFRMSSVAQRTRAKRKNDFEKMISSMNVLKKKAGDENREKGKSIRVDENKKTIEMCPNGSSDDDEGAGSDIEFLGENLPGYPKMAEKRVHLEKAHDSDAMDPVKEKGKKQNLERKVSEKKSRFSHTMDAVNERREEVSARTEANQSKLPSSRRESVNKWQTNRENGENDEDLNKRKLNKRRRRAKRFQKGAYDDESSENRMLMFNEDDEGSSEENDEDLDRRQLNEKRRRLVKDNDENYTIEKIHNAVSGKGHSGDVARMEGKDPMIESPGYAESETSSSEEQSNYSDDDYGEEEEEKEESDNSVTESDVLRYCSESDLEDVLRYRDENELEVEEGKDDDNISRDEKLSEGREENNTDEVRVRKTFVNAKKKGRPTARNVSEKNLGDIGDGFKKMRAHGLDILVDSNKRDGEKQQRRSINLRPRSVPESGKKKQRIGTYSRPIPIHENEDRESDEDINRFDRLQRHNDKSSKKKSRVGRQHFLRANEDDGASSDEDDGACFLRKKSSKKVEKLPKRKWRLSKAENFTNARNFLLDSILAEEPRKEKLFLPLDEKVAPTQGLPLKFRFEDEDLAPAEKEEWEKEIDSLFSELEMGLTVSDPGADLSSMAGDDHVTSTAKNPAEQCLLGIHQLILEEPIGIICKCCGLVYKEMKDIFPDLVMPSSGRRDWFDFRRHDYVIDGFDVDDLAWENYLASTPPSGSVLNLIRDDIRKTMYHHQLDGFVFLWKNIVGETCMEKLKPDLSADGRGCIISHAPGTGKTCLSIVFIMSLIRMHPMCRPVIVAPRSMLHTWEAEFAKWGFSIPFHNLNSLKLSGRENGVAASMLAPLGKSKKNLVRMTKLYSWVKQTSILGISYQLFEKLAGDTEKEGHDEKIRKILLEWPGLLVLDEGHTPRNEHSQMWKALTKVETWRRIILSGTPFQNNFDELYNTLCLVNPKLSDSITSKGYTGKVRKSRRKSNVEKVRWDSLTDAIAKKTDDSVEKLKAVINPFVHVHRGSILQEKLPGLKHALVILRPTNQQENALQLIPGDLNVLDKVHLVSLISVHPALAAVNKQFSVHNKNSLRELDCSPYAGVKTTFVMELIRFCDRIQEKVLVFSEYIHPLNFIMEHLKYQFSWREGKEVLFMDGKQNEKRRQSSIESLNDPTSKVKVLFASTRACSEGINLVGASRVVLLDVVWNPSVERQAICRAYRLGQKKMVYVYHLITSGTLEVEKYARQTQKDLLSKLVFSCPDSQNNKAKVSATVAEDKVLELMAESKRLNGIFEKIVCQPKESNVLANFNFVEQGQ